MTIKHKILILGTGGTIAGFADNANKTVGYHSGQIGINEIIKTIPGLNNVADIRCEQVFNLSSRLMTPLDWLKLSRDIENALASSDVDGVVVTHGTNTMEETAYFMHLTVHSLKPIVFTGAMRPFTSLSSDGPMNIYQSVCVAADPISVGKGVLVVMNDKIFSARNVTKTNTTNLDTMSSPNSGILGVVENGKVYYFSDIRTKHTQFSDFYLKSIENLPKVDVVYNYAGAGNEAVTAFIENGSKGIVSTGFGDGAFSAAILEKMKTVVKSGIPVVRASRTDSGIVIMDGDEKDTENGFMVSYDLNPQKARILLMLGLTLTNDTSKLQKYFYTY